MIILKGNRPKISNITDKYALFICFSYKRSIDLGLNRGFSGVQAAKHLLGLQAASFHGGPGKKKRTDPAATGTITSWDQLGQK